jgi:hypothetical protein
LRLPLPILTALLLLLPGCSREVTAADIFESNQEAWTRVAGRIAKIQTTIDVMPDIREDRLEIGQREPPLFDAPPAPAGNALTIPWEGLGDLSVVAQDPLGVARRDALHHLASFYSHGSDLDGHTSLPPDTVQSWLDHVLAAEYLLVIKVDKYETPSWIEDTLIPGRVMGTVFLFDLQAGRPLGGFLLNTESVAPEGKRPDDRAMLALLRRDSLLAIRAGVETVPKARPPFSDLLD